MAAEQQEPESKTFTALEATTTFGVAAARRQALDAEIERHTDQAMFSCGSLAPKLRAGSCMDHVYRRCVYALRVGGGRCRRRQRRSLHGESRQGAAGKSGLMYRCQRG